jgi:hypothetical protein
MGGNDSSSVDSHLRRAARAAFWATLVAIASHCAMEVIYLVLPVVAELLEIFILPPSQRYTWPIGRVLSGGSALLWLFCAVHLARAAPRGTRIRWLTWFVMLVAVAAVLWRAVALTECCLLLGGSRFPEEMGGAVRGTASVVRWMRPTFIIAVGLLVYLTIRIGQPHLAWLRWRLVALIIIGVAVWVLGYAIERRLADIPVDWPSDSEEAELLEWAFRAWGFGQVIPLLGWRLWLAYITWRAWRWREKPTATDEQQTI